MGESVMGQNRGRAGSADTQCGQPVLMLFLAAAATINPLPPWTHTSTEHDQFIGEQEAYGKERENNFPFPSQTF